MPEVHEVDTNLRLPSDLIRIVAMQPFVRRENPAVEPYRWASTAIPEQIRRIGTTLDLAEAEQQEAPAHFTVLPEYAIPGVDGVREIESRVVSDAWPSDTVVIGGIHGLDPAEFSLLLRELDPEIDESDAEASSSANEWINCCVIWLKDSGGRVRRFLQLKLRPSWEERHVSRRDMREGNAVWLFRGRYAGIDGVIPCRFLAMLCYDWVAIDGSETAWKQVLSTLHNRWTGSDPRQLSWVFVLQHNPQPNHRSFLINTAEFLTQPSIARLVDRKHCAVFHLNTAAQDKPCRTGRGGSSSFVFAPTAPFDTRICRPTAGMNSLRFRRSDLLGLCKDVVFREAGECAHRFEVRVPNWVASDPGARNPPIRLAEVHSLTETTDPRLPGGQVPASLKWVNDELDVVRRLCESDLRDHPFERRARDTEDRLVRDLRVGPDDIMLKRIEWARARPERSHGDTTVSDPDGWETDEEQALAHILYSLVAMGIGLPTAVANDAVHGWTDDEAGVGPTRRVRVVAVRGENHTACAKYFDAMNVPGGRDPILVVLRDRENHNFMEREVSTILDGGDREGMNFVSYQSLIHACRTASSEEDFREHVRSTLPGQTRII